MKAIKFAVLSSALALVAAMACKEKFLEVPQTASFTEAKLTTKAGIEGSLVGAYAVLTGRHYGFYGGAGAANWFWGTVLGGDANKGSNSGDGSQMNEVQRYATQTTNNTVYEKYAAVYEGIVRANIVLASLAKTSEPMTEEEKNRIAGEARFLRGHYYFDLKKIFNNTPYADENTGAATVKNNIDLWPKIEADFLFAYKHLPETQSAVGRANKWAAAAYLAKTYLYQGKYDGKKYDKERHNREKYLKAKEMFDEVISKGKTTGGLKYALMEKYGDLFQAATSDNNKESVFQIEAAVGTGSASNANRDFILNYPYTGGPAGCCGFIPPSFDLVNSFRTSAEGLPLLDGSYNNPKKAVKSDMGIESKESFVPDNGNLDPRLDYSAGRRGIPYWNWGNHPGKSWIRDQSFGGPYSPKKFVYNKGDAVDVSTWNNLTGNNYSIIRFADVLLMAAEAEAELGNLEAAKGYVNQVRGRAQNQDHSCSYAGSFHLPCFIYSGRKGVPSQQCRRSIGKRIKPPFVNAFGKAIGIHCRGRSFKIRVISVEQLVPKPRTRLEGSQSFDMLSKQVQYFRSIRVIFRQHVKKFCFGEDCPTVSSCPMKLRMFGHAFRPSVHINAFFDVKHFA